MPQVHAALVEELKLREFMVLKNPLKCRWRFDVEIDAGSKEEHLYQTVVIRNHAQISVTVVDSESSRVVSREISPMRFNNVQDADVGRAEAVQDTARALFTAHPEILSNLTQQRKGS